MAAQGCTEMQDDGNLDCLANTILLVVQNLLATHLTSLFSNLFIHRINWLPYRW